MKQEFKKLQKENKKFREKIDTILLSRFSSIDDDYSDIWELINELVNNEIEQEKFCNE